MSDKIKIFTISDHPLSPSGVGTQTKYIIEGMLKTGKYQFVSFGGAIKHPFNHIFCLSSDTTRRQRVIADGKNLNLV